MVLDDFPSLFQALNRLKLADVIAIILVIIGYLVCFHIWHRFGKGSQRLKSTGFPHERQQFFRTPMAGMSSAGFHETFFVLP